MTVFPIFQLVHGRRRPVKPQRLHDLFIGVKLCEDLRGRSRFETLGISMRLYLVSKCSPYRFVIPISSSTNQTPVSRRHNLKAIPPAFAGCPACRAVAMAPSLAGVPRCRNHNAIQRATPFMTRSVPAPPIAVACCSERGPASDTCCRR